jgi:hypothetical protein
MKKLLPLLTLFLSACGTQPVVSTPQIVKVPVTVYCKIKPVEKPAMPFDEQATLLMSPLLKAQLYAAQGENLKGYTTKLEAAIAGCTVPLDNTQK